MRLDPIHLSVVLSLTLAATSHGALVVINESFESFDAGTGSGSPTAYQYPNVTDWTYSGAPTTPGLLGAISETLGTIPLTPHGDNWLLVDSRIATQNVYQSLGTISDGDELSISALIGRPTNAAIADFELGLYRSVSGGGVQMLTAIGLSDPGVAGLAAGATVTATANYTATAADAGETLFVRIGLLSGDASPVDQAVIDDVSVIPEPASLALVALGGLVALRRRR
jgi:hypothetical protein